MITHSDTGCARKSSSFLNLKTNLHATQHFHTDSYLAQCCLEFSWDGALVSATLHCDTLP